MGIYIQYNYPLVFPCSDFPGGGGGGGGMFFLHFMPFPTFLENKILGIKIIIIILEKKQFFFI